MKRLGSRLLLILSLAAAVTFGTFGVMPVSPLPASVAHAQGDDTARAKEAFQQGVAQYEKAQYDQALVSFQEAYRLKPHPLVRVNLANCYDRLDRPVEAIFNFEQFLDSKEGSPDQRGEVKHAVKELRKRVGKLALKVTPDESSMTIDGGEAHRTPLTEPLPLKVGKHWLVVEHEGYETISQNVEIASDQTVNLQLNLVASASASAAPIAATAPVAVAEAAQPTPQPSAAEAETTDTAPPPAESEPEATASTGHRPIPASVWIMGTTTIALAIGGTITGLIANASETNFKDNLRARFDDRLTVPQQGIAWDNANTAADRTKALAITTDALFGAAIVGAIFTTYLFITRPEAESSETALAPIVHPHGAALSMSGRF